MHSRLCIRILMWMAAFPRIYSTYYSTFPPPADLDTAFDDLFTEIRNNFNNDMDDIVDYFEDTHRATSEEWTQRHPNVPEGNVERVQPYKKSFTPDEQ